MFGYALPFASKDVVESCPAKEALTTLQNNSEAKQRLANMQVQISRFTGTLNIFNSTKDDLIFFSEIINNSEYTYDPIMRLSSFYY